MLRGKFIALNASIRKKISNLILHVKNLEKEKNKPKANRWKIWWIKPEINEIETGNQYRKKKQKKTDS